MKTSTATNRAETPAGHELQNCSCGWSKVTSEKGLKIHQGRKKCLEKLDKRPRIDRYLLRARSDQSSETQWQDNHHSPQGISTSNETEPSTEQPTNESPEPIQPRPAAERWMKGRKPQIVWPKSSQKNEWHAVDTDLTCLLEAQKGSVEQKLDKMGDVMYNYGAERFGTKLTNHRERKEPSAQPKSRRQQEMERLVKERRQLRKQWKKAAEAEKKGLEALQEDLKQRLAKLRRAERLRKQHKKKERARTGFYRDPYRFTKNLFDKGKSGSLKVTARELEEHLRKTYSDGQRHEPAVIPHDMPPIHQPKHQMDTEPPKWSEVTGTVKRARAASAPGPNGILYKLYKNAPGILKYLWKLLRVAWQKEFVPKAWRRSGGIVIPIGRECLNHKPVQTDQPTECRGKDLLWCCIPEALRVPGAQ